LFRLTEGLIKINSREVGHEGGNRFQLAEDGIQRQYLANMVVNLHFP
jgi:hypothetical protein